MPRGFVDHHEDLGRVRSRKKKKKKKKKEDRSRSCGEQAVQDSSKRGAENALGKNDDDEEQQQV